MQRQAKIAFFISNECKNRVSITRIWNWVINFGTGSGYPVSATNNYLLAVESDVREPDYGERCEKYVGDRRQRDGDLITVPRPYEVDQPVGHELAPDDEQVRLEDDDVGDQSSGQEHHVSNHC